MPWPLHSDICPSSSYRQISISAQISRANIDVKGSAEDLFSAEGPYVAEIVDVETMVSIPRDFKLGNFLLSSKCDMFLSFERGK